MNDPYPIDEVNPYSEIRVWLYDQLEASFPNDGLYDDNTKAFWKWTYLTHGGYLAAANTIGFSTCTSFLWHVNRKIQEQGGLMRGAKKDKPSIYFGPFVAHMGAKKGWHTFDEIATHPPQDGDFYQTLSKKGDGSTGHCGVFHRVFGNVCTVIGGGADHDGVGAIARHTGAFPERLMGWLDIEEFYADWKNKDVKLTEAMAGST